MNLKDKVALVTGGARDIGKAVSLKLATQGANVVVNYHNNRELGEQTLDEIRDIGGTAILVKADVTSATDAKVLVDAARREYGGSIDILVNVAGGIIARKSLQEMDEEFVEKVLRLNLVSTFLMTKRTAPHMPAGSSIINFASQAGRDGGGPGAAAYATSKAAVMGFTRAMAKELGPGNIRVNCVCPGMISTSFHDQFTKDEVRSGVAAATPLRREGCAEEVASLVAYLASRESGFINGDSIDINGGLVFS
ncbi:MAG: glucose 1-dehydrogenase [Halieaceae bacterium]|nr:glucose 1-dehydrogenase [Halieaceae bacterium]